MRYIFRLKNDLIFYIYAETENGRYIWGGDREFTIENAQRTAKFRKVELNLTGMDSIMRSFKCDSI